MFLPAQYSLALFLAHMLGTCSCRWGLKPAVQLLSSLCGRRFHFNVLFSSWLVCGLFQSPIVEKHRLILQIFISHYTPININFQLLSVEMSCLRCEKWETAFFNGTLGDFG